MFFFMTHKEDQNKMSDLCRRIVLAAAHLSEPRAVALDRFRTDGGAAAVLEAPHHSRNGKFYSSSRAKDNKEDNATQKKEVRLWIPYETSSRCPSRTHIRPPTCPQISLSTREH